MEPTQNPTQRGALTLTALAYFPAVLCMMVVGVIVPFIGTLSADLATAPPQIGLAIALFSLPAAILATMGGGLVDKFGVRRSMLCEAGASAFGSLWASQAHSLLSLDSAMVVAGLGFGGMCVTSPCLIIACLSGGVRIRAMSFWSTYAPTGYAAGLLLAVPFTAAGNWRLALLVHTGLMAVAFVSLLIFVPRVASVAGVPRDSFTQTFARVWSVVREPRALRLGIAVALPNAVSYGTSLSAPSYLARVHHLSMASSSATVAFAKIVAMIIGGTSMGYLLSRAVNTTLLFAVMVVVGLAAQALLFLPTGSMLLASFALVLWLFAFGGMSGGGMSLLPSVAPDASRTGAASGLVNQFISLASFATPSIWLALSGGTQYVLLAGACLLISLFALPASKPVIDLARHVELRPHP
jgi:predicted MFS family arabinose efflux permease